MIKETINDIIKNIEYNEGNGNVTFNSNGKQVNIENYTNTPSGEQLEKMAKRILKAKEFGLPVNQRSVIYIADLLNECLGNQMAYIIYHILDMYENDDEIIIGTINDNVYKVSKNYKMKKIENKWKRDTGSIGLDYHKITKDGYKIAKVGQGEHLGIIYGTIEGFQKCFNKIGIGYGDIFMLLSENEKRF